MYYFKKKALTFEKSVSISKSPKSYTSELQFTMKSRLCVVVCANKNTCEVNPHDIIGNRISCEEILCSSGGGLEAVTLTT